MRSFTRSKRSSLGTTASSASSATGRRVPAFPARPRSWPGWPSPATPWCFAENEARSPWEPLHVARGYAPETSTVTVVAVRGIYPVTEGTQTTGQGVVETVVAAMRYLGTPIFHQMRNRIPVVVALCPEHAQEIGRAGFGRRQLCEHLY